MADQDAEPLTKEAILRALRENRALLDRFSVRSVGLFGSFATGQQGQESDIDLLVEFECPTYGNYLGLTDELERLFGRKVGILTPDGLDSIRIPQAADSIRRTLAYG